jgi:hypothetical protein
MEEEDIKDIIDKFNIDKCPVCNFSIQPSLLMIDKTLTNNYDKHISVVYKCPRNECNQVFNAYYEISQISNGELFIKNIGIASIKTESNKFNIDIRQISSNFDNIYNQSIEAENLGLIDICGPGYRKALEFLIKDYLIYLHSEKEEEIKKKFLGKCIKDYEIPSNIKDMAEKAVWIGNDETHYVRKWEDKDLQDLKNLINIVVYWIMMEESTKEYKESMDR